MNKSMKKAPQVGCAEPGATHPFFAKSLKTLNF